MSEEPVCLLAVGTAVPDSIFPCDEFLKLQRDSADFAISKLDASNDEHKARIDDINKNFEWVKSCAENSGIEKRHGVVPEEGKKNSRFLSKI